MKLVADEFEFNFDNFEYETHSLSSIDLEIRLTDDVQRIAESIMDTDSCIRYDEENRDQFIKDFSTSQNIYFFEIEGGGYARAVEMGSEFGAVLALDAIKTPKGQFDLDSFRAGVLGVIKYGNENDFSHVVGGHNFFTDEDLNPIDLNYNGNDEKLAHNIYFDGEMDEEEVDLNYEVKPNGKGEVWALYDSYLIREL